MKLLSLMSKRLPYMSKRFVNEIVIDVEGQAKRTTNNHQVEEEIKAKQRETNHHQVKKNLSKP